MTYPLADLYNFLVAETEYREHTLEAMIKYNGLTPRSQKELRANIEKLKQITEIVERAEKAEPDVRRSS